MDRNAQLELSPPPLSVLSPASAFSNGPNSFKRTETHLPSSDRWSQEQDARLLYVLVSDNEGDGRRLQ